ncbi:MAG TPA: hypothetical protein VD998_02100, partial [Verrucomicrobiae bacterium]|nr:hypothetical protein [Verrucomicrobiae bacterium]
FGLNYGAGLGQFRTGNISRRKVRQEFNFSLANPQLTQVETHETIEIKQFVEEEAGRYGGLALKLEAVGTILVAPGTKLRVGWGYNTLGFERFSATFVHLFGVRQKPALNR